MTSLALVVLDAIRILWEAGDGVPIVGNLVGPVSVASSVMEPTRFYKQLVKERAVAHEYMDFVTDELIKFGLAQIEVRSLTRTCIRNGSDIVSPACGLGMGSPAANVRAVLEEVKSGR